MSISQTNITTKHGRNSYLEILNQDKSINTINMSIPQVKTQELSMCNQETSTHWSTHQMPHLLHLEFKLDPLNFLQWSRHFVDLVFWLMRFPLDGELNFYLKMILFIKKNDLESPLIFVLFLKRVNKIRKKTLSMTPYFGKVGLWKTRSGSGVRLLIGKVR